MTHASWMLPLALVAGTAAASAPDAKAPAFGYDIVTQVSIPAGVSCGHYPWDNGNGVGAVDWAVDGVVVAENVSSGINYQNNGVPYTVAFGEVNGGVFTEWYSETFYPVADTSGGPPPACLEV
ncbi:MAG TPA: hypothetical protein VLK84_06685 [Longimicrobium sp.]|nr:hypothetical protein [Longimicrobium sp.]